MQSNAQSTHKALQAAVTYSISNGNFADTRFYLPSSRTRTGFVTNLRPVFANSSMFRRASPEFDKLLAGGFAESLQSSFSDNPCSGLRISEVEYGYESDSDLEDASYDSSEDTQSRNPSSDDVREDEVPGEDWSPGTWVNEDESNCVIQMENDAHAPVLTKDDEGNNGYQPPTDARMSRTVVVKDVAFKTWKALITYIYTEDISFASLKSRASGKGMKTPADSTGVEAFNVVEVSPKSIYRLADKYDLPNLKELSKAQIKTELNSANICKELFSTFASRHPEIRQLLVDFFCENCLQSDAIASLPGWVSKIAQGHLAYTQDSLVAILLGMAAKANHPPTPSLACYKCEDPHVVRAYCHHHHHRK